MLDEDFKPLSDSEKETMLQDFENDKLKRVIATGTWGTGVDFTYLDIVCIASAPSGEINSIQWTGRGTRVNKNKKLGIVVDSSDMWDPWMRSRALNRIKFYKERNWEIVTHD
jgi:superfamily II DNA or RNA helicase